MKNNIKKIAVTLMCIITLASCFAFVGCENKEDCFWCDNDPATLGTSSTWREEISTTATCLNGGITTIQCSACKRTANIQVSALGHNYEITKDEATCLQDGNTYYTCNRKGCTSTKTEWSKASSLKHKWVLTSSHETITYEYKDYKCSICSQTKSDKTKVNMGYSIKNTQEEFYYATGAAKKIVEENLKYPSSAKFIKESQMEVHKNFSGTYFIEGAVSAPNAFGVYTDFYFIVKTKIRVTGNKFTWYDYDCALEE